MVTRKVVLRDTDDALGSRYLAASLHSDGSLVISGQDLGGGVSQFFGYSEYEWHWTVAAQDVGRLADALGSGNDLLAALRRRFANERASELRPFLEEHDIPFESWSRIGD